MITRKIIEDLLLEVSVYHPIPNFSDKEHVQTLIYVCEQKGYSHLIPFIKETLLNEKDEEGKESKLFPGHYHLGGGYYATSKDGEAIKKSEDGRLRILTTKEKEEKKAEKSTKPSNVKVPAPPTEDDIEAELPPALKPSKTLSPVQTKKDGEEGTPEDKEKEKKDSHQTAKEDPEKILSDPQASTRSKAVARDQHAKNNLAIAGAPNKDSDAKGEFKSNPELEPKTDEEGNVEGTDIPAETVEDPDPKFVGWVATQLDKFGDKVIKEEERAQQRIIDQMKEEGKLPPDFKAVGGREMGFGFKHPALKDKPELQKELADRIKKENKPPHFNLCTISIPGTNKFCDENLGIPREKMPQLGGKPKPGSQGEAKAKRIADENVRKKMGLGIDTPIPPSRQSEYDELYSKENISHVNVEKEFEDYLKSEGIAVSPAVEVPAASLKATQSELVGEQVVGMVDSLEEDPNNPFITAPIMVTKDGYVIDGHHRWAAIQTYNMKHCPPNGAKPCISMKVRIVDEDIETHIPRANAFADRMGIETMSGKAKGSEEKTTGVPPQQVTKELPEANPETFTNKSDVPNMKPEEKQQVSMKIDELNKMVADAKAKGEKAPDYNLCEITVPGTNLYCDDNLGIPREEMPQFKGKPQPGTPAAEMPKDKNGEVDTEPLFRKMLADKGIKTVETEIPSDRLKATQSELVGAKVAGMTAALEKDPNNPGITAPIYVSRDGYVIDGHHRWAAMTSHAIRTGQPTNMKVIVIDQDAKDIIPMANKFAEEQGVAAKKASASEEGKKKEEPKPTDDKPGEVGKSDTGKKYYSIGGGYYSDTPGGEAKYIRVESVVNLAIETDKQIWWNLLFETAINGNLIDEAGKNKKIKGPTITIKDESGENKKLVKLPTVPIPGAPKDTEDGEKPEAPSTQPSQPEPEPIDSEETTDETEETEAESGEAVEIDLDKLSKTAKQREENLDKAEENARKKMGLPAEGEVPADKKEEFDKEVKANKKQKKNYEASKQKLFKEKISKIKDKPSGIREALRKTIFNEPLTTTEKTLLSNHVRIVEPTGAKPNALKIYVAQEPGNFNRKSGDKKTKPLSFELGAGSAEGLIRDIMGANGVQNIATSAFGGKKSTAGQMYTDESGKTATLKPQPTVKRDPQSEKIQSVTFGTTILSRLDENEEGISEEEKIRRERSNRNLDEFGKQIEEGKLKFVDTDSGIWPDTADNRAYIIQDSLSKMHDKLLAMAEKAGARPGSEAMKLLDRLKKLSTLDPNQNPEAWYKEYNDLFHDIAKTEEEPKLGECWANVAEIWVTLGEMQGKGQGTEQGIMALLPESTTLETVDVIKLGKNTDAANRTIVTIDGISVKKEAGGASAMVPKLRKTNFKDLDGSDGKTFKDEITGFGAKGAGSIYGLSNTLEEAKAECGRWETYHIETAKEPGKKRKKPSISEKNCAIISKINSEAKYNKILLEQQSNYQNEMADQSRRWEESGRLPKGYTDGVITEMKTQSEEGGMIWNALEKIKTINPIYKNLKGTEKALWEKQMLKKLQNYYLHIYISHVAYNQNIESQDFENDSVYTKTDEESGEGKIDIHKSDGIRRISFMNPTFNVGWSPSGRPSNFAAGRLVPLDATEEKGRSMGLFQTEEEPVNKSATTKKSTKPKSQIAAKKKKKKPSRKRVNEIIKSLPIHIKERILTRLKERKEETNSKVEKLKQLVRKRIRK